MSEPAEKGVETSWRYRLSGGKRIVAVLYHSDPRRAWLMSVLTISSYLAQPLTPAIIGRLVDAVVAHQEQQAIRAALVLALVSAASSAVGVMAFRMRMRLREVGRHAFRQHTAQKVGGIPGVEHLERPDVADKVELLRGAQTQLSGLMEALVLNIAMVISALLTLAVLAQVSPWFVLLVAFGFPTVWVGVRNARANADLLERITPPMRTMRHLREVLESPEASGEVRVFGLSRELADRHQGLWSDQEGLRTRLALRNQLAMSSAWLLFAAGYLGALAMIVARAIEGTASPGDVAVVTLLGAQVRGVLVNLVTMVNWLVDSLRSAGRFRWMEDVADDSLARLDLQHGAVPDQLTHGIDLVGVSFRYPGTDRDVLTDVTLHLPAGSTVAIVGDNGAGKSTLVKLLARFYEPTEGEILVDGMPLRTLDLDQWRAKLSAGFQDFARFELKAVDAVGVGRSEVLDADDLEQHVVAAMGRASSSEVIADLPDGLQTQLGSAYYGGVQLSGGQWQKLALGRSMMRHHPLLLLLDEPTAALDARAEHELFERYAGAADSAAGQVGGITLLVSHRFSTVRTADLILVVDGGRIATAGSHDDLMAEGGLYAELYELQAQAYR